MKTRLLPLFTLCGAIAGTGIIARAQATTSTQATVTATIPASGAPRFSGRINEIVSLTASGVDQAIVLSYIQNSPGPFQPSADEIIKLRDAGVATPVITAMMQRGAELRDKAQALAVATAQSQSYAQSAPTYSQPAPVTVVTPPTTYVQPSSSVVYVGGSDAYPYYYSSGYSYPYYYGGYPYYYSRAGYYGPSFSFNFGSPFRIGFHDGFHGGVFGGGFHGGVGGGFHGGIGGGGGFHGGGGGGFHGGGGGGMHH